MLNIKYLAINYEIQFSYKAVLQKKVVSSSSSVQFSYNSVSTVRSIILLNIKCPQLPNKPLSHRDSGKYTDKVTWDLTRVHSIFGSASDFPESESAFTPNP